MGMVFAITAWRFAISADQQQMQTAFDYVGRQTEKELTESVRDRIRSLIRMGRRIAQTKESSYSDLQVDASALVEHYSDIDVISVEDLEGNSKWTFPQGAPDTKSSFDLSGVYQRSKSSREPAISPILDYFNGRAFLIVVPLFNRGAHQGYLVARVFTDPFFAKSVFTPGYITEISDQGKLFYSKSAASETKSGMSVTRKIQLPGTEWQVTLRPQGDTLRRLTSWVPEIILFGGVAVTLTLALCVHLWLLTEARSKALRSAYDELQETHERIRVVFEVAPVGIYQTDLSNKILFANRKWEEITGLPGNGTTQDAVLDLLHGEDRPRLISEFEKAQRSDRPASMECRLLMGIDQIVWVQIHIVSLKDPTGARSGYLVVTEDVTNRKNVENELRESHRFLEVVLDSLPTAVVCKDVANGYRYSLWNKKAAEYWGLTKSQAIGRSDFDFFPPEEANSFRQKDRETMNSGQPLDVPLETVTAAGKEPRYVHVKKVPIFDSEGRPQVLLGIAEDITEKKKQDDLIQMQQAQIHYAEKMTSMGQMAGGIAHEINSPLAIIELLTTNLSNMLTNDHRPEVHEGLKKISNTAMRIAKIVAGLRTFARDGEADPFVTKPVNDIIQETLDFCRQRFRNHDVELRVAEIPQHVALECRPVQISQILLNLLNNSYDAIIEAGKGWIAIDYKLTDKFIHINITDSGTMKPGVADRIMQPFFTTKELGRGSGLGLSISLGLAKSHGGDLYFEPQDGRTRFVLKLPMRQAHQQSA